MTPEIENRHRKRKVTADMLSSHCLEVKLNNAAKYSNYVIKLDCKLTLCDLLKRRRRFKVV